MLNRDKLKSLIDSKGIDYTDLYDKAVEVYGLDISYKGFMSLLSNRSSWKLLYAYAISDILNVKIHDLFDVVDVDVNKKINEKKEWREKYQKDI